MITKDFFTKTVSDFETSRQVDDNFLLLMFEYYKDYFPEGRRFINEFGDFKNKIYLWINTPVTTGNTSMEMMSNIRNQTIQKGITNTINHFKQKFNT